MHINLKECLDWLLSSLQTITTCLSPYTCIQLSELKDMLCRHFGVYPGIFIVGQF